MFSAGDMKDVLNLGGLVQDCRSTDELRTATLELLVRVFKCDGANFFLTDNQNLRLDLENAAASGITCENLEKFRKYYFRLDPFLKRFPSPEPVLTLDEVAPSDNLIKSEYFNDFLKPQAIRRQMTLTARFGGNVLGVVALFRPGRGRPFSERERMKAGLMAPHLAGALEKAGSDARLRRLEAMLRTMAEELPFQGVLVLDENLSPLHLKGRQVLQPLLGPAPEGVLPNLNPETLDLCREALLDYGKTRNRNRKNRLAPAEVQAEDGLKVEVKIMDFKGHPPLVLLLAAPQRERLGWEEALTSRGVSRREKEVIRAVAGGLTNTEAARKLFISEHTAENHLKPIFRKLGVKNRTSLLRLLIDASGP